jgi:hypothetical protein
VCGATAAHTCGACTSDTQCANDATYSGANPAQPICETTAGAAKLGQCVANPATGANRLCANADNNHVCPVNSADFCCGNQCVPGNCCDDTDCVSLGTNFNCLQNTCTQCNSVVGNSYFVDPINGDDTGATGSGMSGTTATAGCSFRTLTKAIDVITHSSTATAPAGTTVTIVGRTGGATSIYTVAAGGVTAESLPITVPTNVTITTKTGPVTLTLPAAKTGFSIVGSNANLRPISTAALTIDGVNRATNIGIAVDPTSGSVGLGYVTVTNTGGDGIQVKSGTATFGAGISVTGAGLNGINISGTGTAIMNAGLSVTNAGTNGINISGTGVATIGPGVTVTGAGTTANPANGLNISGTGSATITVGAGEASTAFDSNSQYGIAVADTGVLAIAGAVPTTGNAVRTVSAKSNTASNVYFASSSATVSTISYFYSYGSTEDGLQIAAGSTIRVRHSVFRHNTLNGIQIVSSDTNILTNIDLGAAMTPAASVGNNELQSTGTTTKNGAAGLCVHLTVAGAAPQALNAMGNQFANYDCTAAAPGTIAIADNCSVSATLKNIGVVRPAGTPAVTVNDNNCE